MWEYLTQVCGWTTVLPVLFNFSFCATVLFIWYTIRCIFPGLFSSRVCFFHPFKLFFEHVKYEYTRESFREGSVPSWSPAPCFHPPTTRGHARSVICPFCFFLQKVYEDVYLLIFKFILLFSYPKVTEFMYFFALIVYYTLHLYICISLAVYPGSHSLSSGHKNLKRSNYYF